MTLVAFIPHGAPAIALDQRMFDYVSDANEFLEIVRTIRECVKMLRPVARLIVWAWKVRAKRKRRGQGEHG